MEHPRTSVRPRIARLAALLMPLVALAALIGTMANQPEAKAEAEMSWQNSAPGTIYVSYDNTPTGTTWFRYSTSAGDGMPYWGYCGSVPSSNGYAYCGDFHAGIPGGPGNNTMKGVVSPSNAHGSATSANIRQYAKQLDYIVYHGKGGPAPVGGATPQNTARAIWYFTQRSEGWGNAGGVTNILISRANAYAAAGGGGPEAGCAHVYYCYSGGTTPIYSTQCLIVGFFKQNGKLKITKTVKNATEVNANKEFTFWANLPEGGPYPYSGSKSGTIKDKGTFTLKAGESITIEKLPAGTDYSFYELTPNGFVLSGTNLAGKVIADETVDVTAINTYSATGSWVPTAKKVLEGRSLAANQFTFTLKKGATKLQTSKNDAEGNVTFTPISYSLADVGKTYTYTVQETAGGKAGYTNDTHVATYTVSVADNGDGTLKITDAVEGSTEWENIYACRGQWHPEVTKTLVGKKLTAGEFKFELHKENATGELLQTVTNDASGKVTFDDIEFTNEDAGKTFSYAIVEVDESEANPNIVYSELVTLITVIPTDNGDGTMSFTDQAGSDGNYINAMSPGSLSIGKVVEGDVPGTETAFPISVTFSTPSGENLLGTFEYTGDFAGTVASGGVIYLRPGQRVTINGLPDGTNWSVSESNLPNGWAVLGVEPESGTIEANQTDEATVTNTYDAQGSVVLTAHKVMNGKDLEDSEFEFVLKDGDGNEVSRKRNDANGVITFDPLEFSLADVGQDFYYYANEVDSGRREIIHDTHTVCYKVTPRDLGNGAIDCDVETVDAETKQFDATGPVFRNDVEPGRIVVEKGVNDDAYTGMPFEFELTLYDNAMNPVNIDLSEEHLTKEGYASAALADSSQGGDAPTAGTESTSVSTEAADLADAISSPEDRRVSYVPWLSPEARKSSALSSQSIEERDARHDSILAAQAENEARAVGGTETRAAEEPEDIGNKSLPFRIMLDSDAIGDMGIEDYGSDATVLGEVDGTTLVGFVDDGDMARAIETLSEHGSEATEDVSLMLSDEMAEALPEPPAAGGESEDAPSVTDEVDVTTAIDQDGDGEPDEAQQAVDLVTTPNENPFVAVTEGDAGLVAGTESASGRIKVAILDTGAPEGMAGISVIGDDGIDRNGHATAMWQEASGRAPEAEFVFVKVLDDTGHGAASSAVAGLAAAREAGADIVLMSMSAYVPDGAPALREAVADLASAGVTVVAAAGNGGVDVSLTVPGGIEEALTIGAANADGTLQETSNRGKSLDWLVSAGTTSHAAAKAAGIVAAANGDVSALARASQTEGEGVFVPSDDALLTPEEKAEADMELTASAITLPSVRFGTHFSNVGDEGWHASGATKTNANQRLEAFTVAYVAGSGDSRITTDSRVKFTGHVCNIGWPLASGSASTAELNPTQELSWTTGPMGTGTAVSSLADSYFFQNTKTKKAGDCLEAIKIKLTGSVSYFMNVNYTVRTGTTQEPNTSGAPKHSPAHESLTAANGNAAGTVAQNTPLDSLKVWLSPKTSKLTLNPNNGKFADNTTASKSLTLTYGSTTGSTLGTAYNVSRTGYTFGGWYSGSTQRWKADRSVVAAANFYTTDGYFLGNNAKGVSDVNVSAKWTAKKFDILVNPNGGSYNGASGATDSAVDVTYDSATGNDQTSIFKAGTATARFYRRGYTYQGLYSAASGGVQVYDANGNANTTATGAWWSSDKKWVHDASTSSITLYAHWAPIDYTFDFQTDGHVTAFDVYKGGTLVQSDVTTYHVDNAHINDVFEARNIRYETGYSYSAPTTTSNPTGLNGSQTLVKFTMGDAAATVTLNTASAAYYIEYDANGGAGNMSVQTASTGGTTTLSKCTFYKVGSSFAGWNTRADGSGAPYLDEQSVTALGAQDTTVTLYAQWQPVASIQRTGDGTYRFTVQANMVTVLSWIPSGTHYVIEEINIPQGWRLINKINNMGDVVSLADSYAMFENTTDAAQPGQANTQFSVSALKTIDGKSGNVSAGAATFRLTDASGATIEEKSCARGGSVIFQPIDVDVTDTLQPGESETRTYKIEEVPGTDASLTYDSHVEDVTVTITRVDEDNTKATVSYSGGKRTAVFDNRHKPGKLALKKVVPEGSPSGTFTFSVMLTNSGTPIADGTYGSGEESFTTNDGEATVTVDAGGTRVLGGIPAGTHYTVSEKSLPSGWRLADRSDNYTGEIASNETIEVTHTNEYSSLGSFTIHGTKTLAGRTMKEGEFLFVLKDGEGTEVMRAASTEGGTYAFNEIFVTQEDVRNSPLRYTIEEVDLGSPDTTYDSHVESVTVSLVDNGDGTITATPSYSSGGAFSNATKTTSIKIRKLTPTENAPETTEFNFKVTLKPPAGYSAIANYPYSTTRPVTGTVKSGGTIKLRVNEEAVISGIPIGTTYTIQETSKLKGWTLLTPKTVTGTATEDPESSSNMVSFSNQYDASGSWAPTATKVLVGRPLKNGEFEFQLTDEAGNVVSTGRNDATGKVTFNEISFTLDDIAEKPVRQYTMTELNGGDDNIDYDASRITYTVTLQDNRDGTIVATHTSEPSAATFTNRMATGSLAIEKEATGTFAGQASANKDFSFTVTLMKPDGDPLEGEYNSDGHGLIKDGTGTITIKAGETATVANLPIGTTYHVVETVPAGFTLESSEGTIGSIPARKTVTAKFTNSYSATGMWHAEGLKFLEDNDLPRGEFTFRLVDKATDKELATTTNGSTVAVIADRESAAGLAASAAGADAVGIGNAATAEGDQDGDRLLYDIKRGMAAYDYFVTTPEILATLDAETVAALQEMGKLPNANDGTLTDDVAAAVRRIRVNKFVFEDVAVTEPGTYEVKMVETETSPTWGSLVKFDTAEKAVRVVVTDNGDGTLSSEVRYENDRLPEFTNKVEVPPATGILTGISMLAVASIVASVIAALAYVALVHAAQGRTRMANGSRRREALEPRRDGSSDNMGRRRP